MNTDIFGKEERKQMLERIERMEASNAVLVGAMAKINEKLDEMAKEPEPEFGAAEPAPSMAEIQAKRDEEFKATMEASRKDADAKFEEEMGVLKEIRSHMAETNSLLEAILKRMEENPVEPPQVPIYPTQTPPPSPSWTISNKGTGDDKPYIPKSTYIDDHHTPVDEEKEE